MKRYARREDLGLTPAEFAVLRRLNSPQKIRDFLFGLGQNFELDGDTCRPVRTVLRTRTAHCIEGAMVAACALWVHGERPLLMDMRAHRDYDHVVALYRRNGRWGALSKTNGVFLRSRDPVYRSLRELAISYFHEYANRADQKTLREFSAPYDLRRLDPAVWVTGAKNAWELPDELDAMRHFPLMSGRVLRGITRRDAFERSAGKLIQYPRPRALVAKLLAQKKKRAKP